MKPHALRKVLWLGSGALALGVIAVSVSVFQPTHVAAATTDYTQIIKDGTPTGPGGWTPDPPVTKQEIEAVFASWRTPEFERAHFHFVGPIPPKRAAPTLPPDPDAPPKELDALGTPSALLHADGVNVMLFEFESGDSVALSPGDWIRAGPREQKRFRFVGLQRVDVPDSDGEFRGAYAIHVKYGVYAKGRRTHVRTWVSQTVLPENNPIRDVPDEAATVDEEAPSLVPVKPSSLVTLEEAKPRIIVHSPTRRTVAFTQQTWAYLRGKSAKDLAASIKTSPVTRDGRVLGLRVTGFGKALNADVFDVRRGDVLVSVNGTAVTDRAGVVRLLERLPEKQLVMVVIDRNGRLITMRVDPSDPKTRRISRYLDFK